jgi:hypothetical protein
MSLEDEKNPPEFEGGDEYDEHRNTKLLDDFVRFLEIGQPCISHGTEGRRFYSEGHWNAEGMKWSVQEIAKALRERGFGLEYMDPKRNPDEKCAESGCGHPYERHFDGFENNREVGCKYCPCEKFKEMPF